MLYPNIQRELSNHMAMLMSIGFLILCRLNFSKSIKQLIIASIGIIISFFVPMIIFKMEFLKHLKWLYALVGIVSLAMVLILGQVTNGSKISYTIAGITVQPSEFVKVIFVFCIAGLLYKKKCFLTFVLSVF